MARDLAEAPVSQSQHWSDLPKRVVSAAVLALIGLVCLWIGGWLWIALIAAASIGLLAEWRHLCKPFSAVLALAGLVYVLPAAVALVWMRLDAAAGAANTLFVLLIVWATDIGAYLVGRLIGGPRLAPSISPGKTRSGALGGLACALLVGAGAAQLTASPSGRALILAGGLSLAAQAGDLLESAIKRHMGVKDSGRVIPGHGGLFDRLDGLLAAAPLAALLALAMGGGVELWR